MKQILSLLYRNRLCITFYICLFAVLFPNFAQAMEQTGKCHCFRERIFDPQNKFIADDYLLATVGNSLIASHFNISKRQIIMMKMQGGTENNDLLIGLYAGKLTGSDVKEILAKKENTSWQSLVSTDASLQKIQSDPVLDQMRQGAKIDQVGEKIVQTMLQSRFSVSDATLTALKQFDLSPRETALVLILADHTGVPPETITSQKTSKGLSWSEIAHNFGLQPSGVGKLVL